MKIITCDLCKRKLGVEVDKGSFHSLSTTEYSPRGFDNPWFVSNINQSKAVDICIECSNRIIDAQNKELEKNKTGI